MYLNGYQTNSLQQDSGGPLNALAPTRGAAHSASGAAQRAAVDRKHTKLPYKEVSNVSTEDIEKIIAQAKEDGVT
jgi:hypothetical protein